MTDDTAILIGKGARTQSLLLGLANRHGLISGATGTGKTVTLQVLAEGFSRQGVPVFVSDVKGDLSGISQPATINEKLASRAKRVGVSDYAAHACPTVFWDLFGERGHPLRATISEMGPVLLSRLLSLNETQEGVLSIAFQVADDDGLLLLDLKDLRALLTFVAENASSLTATYGTVSKRSVGAIQRRLLSLEQQGAESFFGEPALDLHDFLRTDRSGYGMVNVLAADRLIHQPKLYATFLLWLMSELFEELPEIGDPDRPKLVFFFDEAHLLFDDAPKALVDKVEQVVRLIRSKGVGVYFVTQNPLDIPDDVLGQLGNRVQHALRAFTPRDQKGGSHRRRDVSAEPRPRRRDRDHRARGRRGAGLHLGCQRRPWFGRPDRHSPAGVAHRPGPARRACGRCGGEPVRRTLRPRDRPRIRLRTVAEAGRNGGGGSGGSTGSGEAERPATAIGDGSPGQKRRALHRVDTRPGNHPRHPGLDLQRQVGRKTPRLNPLPRCRRRCTG